MARAIVHTSLTSIDRAAWNACFAGEIESYDYLTAIERAGIEGFSWRYVTVVDADTIVAAAPAFLTDYPLDTTLTGAAKRVVHGIRNLVPGALRLRLGAIGSPCTETACLGFSDTVTVAARPALLDILIRGFEKDALSEGCGLLAVKDAPGYEIDLWRSSLPALGYGGIAGLPIAVLDIDFTSIDAYLTRLSASTRKDMRRKLRSLDDVRIEHRRAIDDQIDAIVDIYNETLARADMTFEELSPAYFTHVLSCMPNAEFILYFSGERLIGFNLLLQDADVLLDKFFCMRGAEGREHNLYFLSWFNNVHLCLERGLKRYQSGQAAYAAKVRLGSRLVPTVMHFRHRNPILSRAMRLAAPLFVPDPDYACVPS